MTPIPYEYFPDGTGGLRKLIHRPSDPAHRALIPTWTEAGNPIVPESEWTAFDETPSVYAIKNQGQFGACDGHATASSLELARYVAGMPYQELSAWYVYSILCQGVDDGASILAGSALLQSKGTCRDSLVPWGTIDPSTLTPAAVADALRFKLEQGPSLTTWPEIMSAVQLRQPGNISIRVGRGFNDLDSEGVPPTAWGEADHAVTLALGAKYSTTWGWLIKIANSWGITWGQNGFFWISERHINVGGFECFAAAAATDDPQDPTKPPSMLVAHRPNILLPERMRAFLKRSA